MKTTVNFSNFANAFANSQYESNFSYDALRVIFDYLENCESETDAEIDFDMVAIACDYSEDTYQGIADNYSIDLSEVEQDDDDSLKDIVGAYLYRNTIVLGEVAGGFVYAAF